MKIEINLKIFFVIILFFLLKNIDTYIIFIIFIFIHEFAHLCFGLLIGNKPRKLYLNPLGVSLEFYSYSKNKFLYRILLFFVGPFSNLIMAIIFSNMNLQYEIKLKIVYTNLALCCFNLIPILPLDGGKILKEILNYTIGLEKSNKFIIIFSKTFLVIISFVYSILILKVKNLFILILLIYLWYLYFMEERKYVIFNKAISSIKNIS